MKILFLVKLLEKYLDLEEFNCKAAIVKFNIHILHLSLYLSLSVWPVKRVCTPLQAFPYSKPFSLSQSVSICDYYINNCTVPYNPVYFTSLSNPAHVSSPECSLRRGIQSDSRPCVNVIIIFFFVTTLGGER